MISLPYRRISISQSRGSQFDQLADSALPRFELNPSRKGWVRHGSLQLMESIIDGVPFCPPCLALAVPSIAIRREPTRYFTENKPLMSLAWHQDGRVNHARKMKPLRPSVRMPTETQSTDQSESQLSACMEGKISQQLFGCLLYSTLFHL